MGYTAFKMPVPVEDVTIQGWNRQHAITEIECPTFKSIVSAGDVTITIEGPGETLDPGGDVVAARAAEDFSQPQLRLFFTSRRTFRQGISHCSLRQSPLTRRLLTDAQ